MGFSVVLDQRPARLEVWADAETATRLFRTMLGLFPSLAALRIEYREGRTPHARSRPAVSRAAIAEAFEALCEYIAAGQRIEIAVASDWPATEMRLGPGGRLRVAAEDLGPFEHAVEIAGLPAIPPERGPFWPRRRMRPRPLGGETATLHNTIERLRLSPARD
jgi:hypothetical protein